MHKLKKSIFEEVNIKMFL